MKKLTIFLVIILLVSLTGVQSVFVFADDSVKSALQNVPTGFVYSQDSKFMLDGKEFKFAGANSYYMVTNPDKIKATFEDYKNLKLKVMRIWAFADGCESALQTTPGVYNENIFKNLDLVLATAKETGIKVVLTFVNYWDAYGGMPQYVKWAGGSNVDEFYTNAKCKQWYKDYVNYIVNRTNTITGVKYKDSPEIFSWNLTNEARCPSDASGDTLYNWVKEMSEYLKSVDPNHMISLGDEGFLKNADPADWTVDGSNGVDGSRILSLPTIDYDTYHLYPTAWGMAGNYLAWGDQWIKDHIALAHAKGKPAVFEEFGLTAQETSTRPEDYDHWLNTNLENGGNGFMVWMVSCHAYEDGAGHDIYTDSLEASVLRKHAGFMENGPSPVISRGVPAFASSEISPASNANDNDYDTYWQGTSPGWLAYDLSQVPAAKRDKIIAVYYNNSIDFDHTLQVDSPATNNLASYTIEANKAEGGGSAPTTGWVTLATVKGNTYHSRQHLLDFAGYNWIRLNITAADDANASSDVKVNFDIHNASLGANDDWIIYGDSITMFGTAITPYTEAGGSGTIAQMINAAKPDYFPVVECGGIGYMFCSDGAANIDNWLKIFPGKYVGLAFGIKEAWESKDPVDFYNNTEKMVKAVLAAGKIPVIPYLTWSSLIPEIQKNGPVLNAKLDELFAKYPDIVKGPDLWTYFKNNPDKLSSDGVHPNKEGYVALRQLWVNSMLAGVYNKGLPVDDQAPSIPSGLKVKAVTANLAELMWSASKDNDHVAGYIIYRDGKQIATSAKTTFTDGGASPNKSYSYTVAAYDAASNISEQCMAVVLTMPAPAPVLKVDNFESYKNNGELQAAWNDAGGNAVKISLDSTNKAEGKYSMKFEYTSKAAQGYSGVNYNMTKNWNGYKGLSIRIKSNKANLPVAIQFRQSSGQYWEYTYKPVGTGWHEIYLPWSKFAPPSWAGTGGTLDLSSIDQFSVYENGDGDGAIYFDDVKLLLDDRIEDFESYKTNGDLQSSWADAGGNKIKVSLDNKSKIEGENCMKYEFTSDGAQGYSGMIHSISQNWNGYKGVSLMVKPGNSADNITVQFREASGDYWEYTCNLNGNDWRNIFIPWSSFMHPSWSTGGKPVADLSAIDQINIYQGGDVNGSMLIDDIKLVMDDGKVSRGDFVCAVVKALGIDKKGSKSFSDVSGGLSDAINSAFNADLVNGYSEGIFKPNANITREEMAAIVGHAIKYMGKDNGKTDTESVLAKFSDNAAIAKWAKADAALCIAAEIMSNTGNLKFSPADYVTKTESAMVIDRLLKYLKK